MGSILPEQTDPDRAGGGDDLVPATALATGGAGGGGRAPAGGDRADAAGWLLALALPGLLALWLFERFDLSLTTASVFFFWSSTLAAFSFPVAAWIARRIGLINTMVYTHIPSSVFLIIAAFSPNLYVALGLLLLRSALSQMDVPTRTSYVMAVVTPAERAAAASVTGKPSAVRRRRYSSLSASPHFAKITAS